MSNMEIKVFFYLINLHKTELCIKLKKKIVNLRRSVI